MVQKSGDHQLRLVVYPSIYKDLYIPGGAGFLPSTVSCYFFGALPTKEQPFRVVGCRNTYSRLNQGQLDAGFKISNGPKQNNDISLDWLGNQVSYRDLQEFLSFKVVSPPQCQSGKGISTRSDILMETKFFEINKYPRGN